MSTQVDDDATMTRYLLGSLSEAETERLDELSITDPDFVSALSAAERDLVDAYVQGELTGADLERFRSAYLLSPQRREKVEFARALHAFGGREERTPRPASRLAALFTLPPALQASLAAAAVVLLVASAWLAVENLRLRQQGSAATGTPTESVGREQALRRELDARTSSQARTESELDRVEAERGRLAQQLARLENPGIVTLALAPAMRSAGSIPDVRVPADVEYVAVQAELEPNDYRVFRAELLDASGGPPLWTSGTLTPRISAGRKTLHITLRAGPLTAQPYVLRVSGVAQGRAEVIGEYRFRVTKP